MVCWSKGHGQHCSQHKQPMGIHGKVNVDNAVHFKRSSKCDSTLTSENMMIFRGLTGRYYGRRRRQCTIRLNRRRMWFQDNVTSPWPVTAKSNLTFIYWAGVPTLGEHFLSWEGPKLTFAIVCWNNVNNTLYSICEAHKSLFLVIFQMYLDIVVKKTC